MLSAEGLRHAFGEGRGQVVALDGVSFDLTSGQTLTIFGPNGAGKTTLLKVLAGLIRPQVGSVHVTGGRRAIGWIGHQSHLYEHLTVRENLLFWAALYGVPAARRAPRAAEVLGRLGMAGRAGARRDRRGVPAGGVRWVNCSCRRGRWRVKTWCSSSARARPSSRPWCSPRSSSRCSTSDATPRPSPPSISPRPFSG